MFETTNQDSLFIPYSIQQKGSTGHCSHEESPRQPVNRFLSYLSMGEIQMSEASAVCATADFWQKVA